MTWYVCQICKESGDLIGLCIENCFKEYHVYKYLDVNIHFLCILVHFSKSFFIDQCHTCVTVKKIRVDLYIVPNTITRKLLNINIIINNYFK